jgi:hypothetical protein
MHSRKLSVEGPRLIPVLVPQPLPMPADKWFEEAERLCLAMEQIALLRERPGGGAKKRPANFDEP